MKVTSMRHIPLKAWAAIMVAAVVSISLVVVLSPQVNQANQEPYLVEARVDQATWDSLQPYRSQPYHGKLVPVDLLDADTIVFTKLVIDDTILASIVGFDTMYTNTGQSKLVWQQGIPGIWGAGKISFGMLFKDDATGSWFWLDSLITTNASFTNIVIPAVQQYLGLA